MSAAGSDPSDRGSASDELGLPWVATPLRRTLATQHAHALLVHGPGGVGQFELALALAKGWLCEADDRPLVDRPCGRCASCKLHVAHSHPDLLVLVPEALRESLGWDLGGGEGEEAGRAASASRARRSASKPSAPRSPSRRLRRRAAAARWSWSIPRSV